MEKLAMFGGPRAFICNGPAQQNIEESTIRALHAAVESARTDWSFLSGIAGGGPIAELESGFAQSIGVSHVLALSSCTTALFTSLVACGVRPGDEVIVPAYSWGQTVGPVLHAGGRPVFADIDLESYTLSPDDIERRITSRTRAVIAVHVFGCPADLDAISRICRSRGLRLIEDAAQAFGASLHGRRVGSWGDAACFSLGRGKPVTGGEGGVLCTTDSEVFERAVALSQHPLRQRYELSGRRREAIGEFGYNFRIHPFAAVAAAAEIAGSAERLARRTAYYTRLSRALEGVPGIRPVRPPVDGVHAYYRYCPTFVPEELADGCLSREVYIDALVAEGVPIAPDPIGMPLHHRRLASVGLAKRSREQCPVAEDRCQMTGLALATWLSDCEHESSIDMLVEAFAKVGAGAEMLRESVSTVIAHREAIDERSISTLERRQSKASCELEEAEGENDDAVRERRGLPDVTHSLAR